MTVTAPTSTNKQLLQALSDQDWDQLDELMNDLAEAVGEQDAQDHLRNNLLPQLSTAAVEAFWRYVMTPEQYDQFIENMVDTVVARLEAAGYNLGSDFSIGLETVYVKPHCLEFIREQYPPERLASLFIILSCPDA